MTVKVNGQQQTVNGQRSTDNGQWSMVNSPKSTVNDQQSTVKIQLSMVHHLRSRLIAKVLTCKKRSSCKQSQKNKTKSRPGLNKIKVGLFENKLV